MKVGQKGRRREWEGEGERSKIRLEREPKGKGKPWKSFKLGLASYQVCILESLVWPQE